VLSAGDDTVQTVGSTVFFLRRRKLDKEQFDYNKDVIKVFIPTPRLISIFEEQRCKAGNHRALELFQALSSHALTRTATGWRHEMEVHRRLCTDGAALHISRSDVTMEILPSTNLLPGTVSGLKQVSQGDTFYWMPSSSNFPGVDSVLGSMVDNELAIFTIQATIANDHTSPAEGITKVWRNFLPKIRAGCTWHYVVVANTNQAAQRFVEHFSEELKGFRLDRNRKPVQVWACSL